MEKHCVPLVTVCFVSVVQTHLTAWVCYAWCDSFSPQTWCFFTLDVTFTSLPPCVSTQALASNMSALPSAPRSLCGQSSGLWMHVPSAVASVHPYCKRRDSVLELPFVVDLFWFCFGFFGMKRLRCG